MDIKNELHMHVWSKNHEDIDEELDLKHVGTYPNMSGPDNNDGYVQFGVTLSDGRWVELRIPFSIFPELDGAAHECQSHWDDK